MTTIDLTEYYLGLNKNAEALISKMSEKTDILSLQKISHNYLSDFEQLRDAISDRPESSMLSLAGTEYQYALFALATGAYRHAFSSLRLTLELSLSCILYSAHEIKYHQWANDNLDLNWNTIIDDDGIFSKNFIRSFCPDMADSGQQFRSIAKAAYRECSQYVHGNLKTHSDTNSKVVFRPKEFEVWHDIAGSVHICLIFSFAARFANTMRKNELDKIQQILSENIGDLTAIQSIYS